MRQLSDGHTARFSHDHGEDRLTPARVRLMPRPRRKFNGSRFTLDPVADGHTTVAYVLDPGGTVVATGVAYCAPGDQFSRRLGREIALGRALKVLEGQR